MDIHQKLDTAIGPIYVSISDVGLKFLGFVKPQNFRKSKGASKFQLELLSKIENELLEYTQGKRKRFSVKLDLQGTDFQKLVWSKLLEIPISKTFSYKEIAIRVGKPKGARAIGNANGKNPVCIIIPCHRVIASDGSLGGYSGGIKNKIKLLELERKK